MPALTHHLSGPPGHLAASTVVCGALEASLATWAVARVDCPACLLAPPHGLTPESNVQSPLSLANDNGRRTRDSRPKGALEKAFQGQVDAALRRQHWTYYHTHRSQHSPSGFPDLVALRKTPTGVRCIVAELKIPPNTPSTAQAQWLDLWRQLPEVEVYVWTPAEWPQILEVLR